MALIFRCLVAQRRNEAAAWEQPTPPSPPKKEEGDRSVTGDGRQEMGDGSSLCQPDVRRKEIVLPQRIGQRPPLPAHLQRGRSGTTSAGRGRRVGEGWRGREGVGVGRDLPCVTPCHATLHHGGVGSSTQTTTDSGRSPWCQEDGDGARVPKIVTQMARNITPAARSHLGDKADRDEVDMVEDVEQDCEPRRWDMGQPHRQPRAREQGDDAAPRREAEDNPRGETEGRHCEEWVRCRMTYSPPTVWR